MEKVKASFRNRWFVASVVLVVSLSTLAGYNIYQNFHYDNLRHFAFAWSPGQQLIAVGETLWINMTTWWDNENFYATVRTNDHDPDRNRELGIVFDENHDWEITDEMGYILGRDNCCRLGGIWHGLVGAFYSVVLDPSPYHVCYFSNVTGWRFEVKFPKTEIKADYPTLIHISYSGSIFPHLNKTDGFLSSIWDIEYVMSYVSFEVVA